MAGLGKDGFHAGDIGRVIDPDAFVIHAGDGDTDAVFEGAQLFETFSEFEWGRGQADDLKEDIPAVAIDAEMFVEREGLQLHVWRSVGVIAEEGDGPTGEIEGMAVGADHHLHDVGIVEVICVPQRGGCGRHAG